TGGSQTFITDFVPSSRVVMAIPISKEGRRRFLPPPEGRRAPAPRFCSTFAFVVEHPMSMLQAHEVPAIQTIDLRREFRTRGVGIVGGKTIVALDGVSLAISQGEIFGLLVSNGSG